MAKVMIFIDGTWLYRNIFRLKESYGQRDFRIDFGKLPEVLALEVGRQMGSTQDLDVVRTNLFGSYASNCDPRDEDAVQSQQDFYDILKEEYHYELEIFPIDFKGKRLRKADRQQEDSFSPKEKCVDIALATSMLYYAAIPYAYDIAIVVAGDRDFKPVLQHARRLGKRVAIASIKGNCAWELADLKDAYRLKDFDTIWLDDLLSELELKYERHQLECQSPKHKGERKVWTTVYPRKGRKFYCPECQDEFARQKQKVQQEYEAMHPDSMQPAENGVGAADSGNGNGRDTHESTVGSNLTGFVSKKVADRGYGFINTSDGRQYFFHFSDLSSEVEFEDVQEGFEVVFEIKNEPANGKAGAAKNVCALVG